MPGLHYYSLTISLILVLSSHPLKGQTPFFRTLDQPADFQTRLVCQDENGFMWLGGEEGLYRYDGQEWEPFLLPESLQAQTVTSIQKSLDQGIWVGFQQGWILHIKPGFPPSAHYWEKVANVSISQVLEDSKSGLWIATAGEGLIYKSSPTSPIQKPVGLPDEYLYSLAFDIHKQLWAATDRGIARLDTSSMQVSQILDRKDGLPDEIIRVLAPVDSGMWMGTYDGGISFFHYQEQKIKPQASWTGGAVTSLQASPNGLWIGTERQGIWHLSGEAYLQKISTRERSRIYQLMLDQEGNLWSAGQPTGLRLAITALLHQAVPGKAVKTLHCGKEKVWFATDSGLFALSEGHHIEPVLVPIQGRISCLYEDQLSYLWVGTQGNGAWRIHPDLQQWQHLTQDQGLISNHILSINGDQNQIWFATFGGANSCPLAEELPADKFQHYNQEDGLGVNYIYQAYIDSRSRVWFATDGKGIRVWENGEIRSIPEMSEATFLNIEEDEGGKIWFHHSDSGLYSWESGHIKAVKAFENTLPARFNGLLADGGGRIVLAGAEGIEIFSSRNGTHWQFGLEEGIAPIGPNLHLLSRDRKGKIWIGTQDGLVCYQPQMLPISSRPQAQLKEVSVLLKRVHAPSPARFESDENHISFTYSGLWFQKPRAIRYQHRLVGLDLDWVSSNNRQIIYPRLYPGKYTFELRVSAYEQFEHSPLLQYDFEVNRHFVYQWWFVGPVSLSLFLLFIFWMRSRENRLRQTERLERNYLTAQFETLKSQVNPHFLFNSFNTLAAIIEDQPKEAVAYVENLSDLFRNILDFREESIISINRELELLDKFYYLQRHRYGDNFRLSVEVPPAIRKQGIPPLTLQMLVENALKHNIVSRKHPLEVRIEVLQEGYLSIRNNLQLRRDNQDSTNLGQQNIQQRYQLLGQQEVRIEISQSSYSVHVPLLSHPES